MGNQFLFRILASTSLCCLQFFSNARAFALPPLAFAQWVGKDKVYSAADQACQSFYNSDNYDTEVTVVNVLPYFTCEVKYFNSTTGNFEKRPSRLIKALCSSSYKLTASDIFVLCFLKSFLKGRNPVLLNSKGDAYGTSKKDLFIISKQTGLLFIIDRWYVGDEIYLIDYSNPITLLESTTDIGIVTRTRIFEKGSQIGFVQGAAKGVLCPYIRTYRNSAFQKISC